MLKKILLFLVISTIFQVDARLRTSGKDLYFNNDRVFLSGVNAAWNDYGNDFGNGAYNGHSKSVLQGWLDQINANGGNSIRIWVHIEGYYTPTFDGSGFVTGTDGSNNLIDELKSFLDYAQSRNVIVIPVLWNGAYLTNQKVVDLFWDEGKLQSYIDNALKPMVQALGNHPALGAWEVINEPEGSVTNNQYDSNPCFDTTVLANTGAGWTGKYIPMKNILKFINWQAQAIKEVNSGSLVTVGSWSEHAQTNAYPESRNYYTDQCLIDAGAKSQGKIDFYQIHTYGKGSWNPNAPFKVQASGYQLDKPLIIGEFATVCSAGESIQTLFNYGYDNGYQGVWTWHYKESGDCTDSQSTQNAGMLTLKGKNGNGGLVNFPVN